MQSQDRWKMERDERVEQSRAQSIRLVILSLPAEKELFSPLLFLNILSVCLSNVRMGGKLSDAFQRIQNRGAHVIKMSN
jgi:hypothetical protein